MELNSKDFCKSKEVTRTWNYFINTERAMQKAYKIRIQEKIQTLTEEIHPYELMNKTTPFHLAAKRGYLPVCQQIMDNSDYKNPKDNYGVTPLHLAAKNGHLSICQFIVEKVDDKHPKND